MSDSEGTRHNPDSGDATAAGDVYVLPASFGQRRLWFLDQIEPGSAAYNICLAMQLRGKPDVAALQAALDALAERHEVLRTSLELDGGEPAQIVHERGHIELQLLQSGPVGSAALDALLADLANRSFNLAHAPLLRACLIDCGSADAVLFFNIHHSIADAWSLGIFQYELATLYAAARDGSTAALPALAIQYGDFAEWQQGFLQGDELQRQLDYWRARLAGAPPLLELPTDRPRPRIQTHRGATVSHTLPAPLALALRDLAKAQGCTPFVLMLAAYQALLARYSGADDIVVGTPIAGRNRRELEPLIGFFVNTLAMRADLTDDPAFSALVQQVKQTVLDAFGNQDLPFEKLVEDIQPERAISYTPVFQTLFVLEHGTAGAASFGDLPAAPLTVRSATAKFDLSLFISESPAATLATFEYNTDLFDRTTIERMLQHFEALLRAVSADPAVRIGTIGLLDAAEAQRVTRAFNATATDFGAAVTAHALVAAQAASTPDAIALESADTRLTYRELNERANRLARALIAAGATPGQRVAISCERSPEMAVAVLAVLKSGAAYVPVDPHYPVKRIRFMLEDSAATILLTQSALAAELPVGAATVIELDRFDYATGPAENPVTAVSAADPLYAIYTSGSTGQPKGVVLTHAGLTNLLRWQLMQPGLREPARTLQFASLSFDVSFQELFSTWAQGGTLVMIDEALRRDLPALAAFISAQRIERVYMPYAALQPLADILATRDDLPVTLADIVSAGEQLQVTGAIRRLAARCGARLHNQYGPSETHVVTALTLDGDPSAWPALPGIGRPVANTRCYVLDARQQPLPVGVPGELWLAGIQVAREYLNRPELNAGKFRPDPFAPGERMYRTGDRVRFLDNGAIDFLGRIDQQVKFRGFRIEPGEIEAALTAYPAVQLAAVAVVTAPDNPADKKLVAYVTAENGSDLATAELRAFLKQRLPEHMQPTHFVVLDAMPVTPSGKVARRLLPAPSAERDAAAAFVAPRNPTEERLTDIWARVLGVDKVSVHDNFFELGGHSLLATQLIARVRDSFGVDVPLIRLFEHPTPAEFASVLQTGAAQSAGAEPAAIVPRADAGPAPLSFSQQRLWFLDQLEPGNPAYNFPVAIEFGTPPDVTALAQALNDLVARHDSLRTTFSGSGTTACQVVAARLQLAIDVQDAPCPSLDDLQKRMTRLSQQAFDLQRGPLLRAHLLHTNRAGKQILLLVAHHIITDGWSLHIILDELAALYRARVTGTDAGLAPLPVQYPDFAVWQRRWLQGDELDRQLSFWRAQLADLPPLLDLPTDLPRPAEQTYRGAGVMRPLGQALQTRLGELARQQDCTLFMVLLTALDVLLATYASTADVVVGTPIAGRRHSALEGLIGFLTNTLALPAHVDRAQPFTALLQAVRSTTLAAYEHQDLPFEKLVEELQPQRAMSHSPVFQVMFVYQDASGEGLDFGGLPARTVSFEMGIAKFDLLLEIDNTTSGMRCGLQYNTDLFRADTVTRMLEHFETLLHAIVEQPDRPVGALPLLDPGGRDRVLRAFNATAMPTAALHVHALVERQVALTPDAIALSFGAAQLSYAELNRRANILARAINAAGAGPGCLVGICMERSMEMAVGVLAVLKAGAAYVPVDPNYPGERIATMLTDAAAPVLLTQARIAAGLPPHTATAIHLDEFVWEGNGSNPAPAGESVYVIYTSGSTGKPKGVELTHANLSNLIQWQNRQPGLAEPARTLQFASLSFDVSFQELFTTWAQGGCVVLVEDEQRRDLPALARLIATAQIERVYLPFAALQPLAEAVAHDAGLHFRVRDVIVAGEQLQVTPAVRAMFRALGDARLHNHYGPSETHVTTAFTLQGDPAAWMPLPPIGKPVANTQVYVLDDRREPVPVGVPGELYLGGVQVAKGYLHQPELTAERFLADPFLAGNRIYRTGDRVRFLADGNLEYLGRTDDQVKWRGFRIEPGEIETVLGGHPAVRQAVVLIREDTPGDRRLVGYVTGADLPGSDALRAWLRERLPDYMVPSVVMPLDALPLTPSGKLARRALPAPAYGDGGRDYVAPRTPLEAELAALWQEVLGVARAGVHDDFFALGGHSLLATQLVSRLRDTLGVELPLKRLFRNPTPELLAAEVAGLQAAQVPAQPDGTDREEFEF